MTMESEQEYLSFVSQEYKDVSSIPLISSATVVDELDDTLTLSVAWSQQDLETKATKNFSTTHILRDKDGSLSLSDSGLGFPCPVQDSCYESVSPSRRLKVIFRTWKDPKADGSGKEQTICEVWSKKEAKMVKSVNVSILDAHGKIHWDSVFGGSQCWSEDESKLVYVAEKKKEKSVGYFERVVSKPESVSTKGDQYVFEENWGEQLEHVTNPVICVLDLKEEVIHVLNNIPMYLSPAEAGWGPGSSIFFVGLWNTPYRLGRIYCDNRKSAVFLTRMGADGAPEQLSEVEDLCVRSVRVSKSKSKLIFLQRKLDGLGEPHRASEKLVVYDFLSKSLRSGPAVYQFSGSQIALYSDGLPLSCWMNDEVHVTLSSVCDGTTVLLVLDTETWYGKVMEPCHAVLLSHQNYVFYSNSSLDCVAFELGVIKISAGGQDMTYQKVVAQSLKRDSRFICGTLDDVPGIPKSHFIIPRNSVVTGPAAKVPLIVWPHGGPHSVFTNAFSKFVQGYSRAGFACLLVNFRGSTGFDEGSLRSLAGHVGVNDVEDCQKSAEHFLQKFQDKVDRELVVVSGGSHGGFLTAHLIGQYPDFYRAAALRNPVVNIPAMSCTSDIPDWCYYECALPFQPAAIPYADTYAKMLAASPVIHVPKVTAPVLLLLGGKDVRVPWSQGKQYFDLLRASDKQAKLLMYPNDNHPLSSVETEADVFVNTCKWFFSHLKGASKRRLVIT